MKRRDYKKKIREFVKVIQYRIQFNRGYIELHDYVKVYDLSKSQMIQILIENKVYNRLLKYNENIIPAT